MRPSLLLLLPLLVVPLAALPLTGCGDGFVTGSGGGGATTTTSSGGSTGGGGGAGGQTTTTTSSPACATVAADDCNKCLVEACAEPYCACAKTSDCIDLAACTAKATEPADYADCWAMHKDSISLAGRVQACGNVHCESCGFPAVTDCLLCEYNKCTAETNNCLGNGKCVQLLGCLDACPQVDPTPCQMDCSNTFADGVQPLQKLLECTGAKCVAPCTM